MPSPKKMQYTNLGRSGLKISKVVLGAMSFGNRTDQMGWVMPTEEALPILKHALDRGMNTWDTADVYSFGDSERIVGAALKEYNIFREKVVILTKLGGGLPDDFASLSPPEQFAQMTQNDGVMANRVGLSRKHILAAVDASVERLGTYIDVLQIHRLDRGTPREEIMKALNDVVESGKVHYLGASSMAAWEFQTLNNIARQNGWHQFISMQNYHSLLHREEEREMHPYCHDAGVGLIPWSPVARGLLTRPYNPSNAEQTKRQQGDTMGQLMIGPVTKEDEVIIGRVEELAKTKGCSMAQVSMMWCLRKGVNPIVGISSIKRVDEAADAVALLSEGVLTDEDVRYLEEPYVAKPSLSHTW